MLLTPSTSQDAACLAEHRHTARILICESHEAVRRMLERMVTRLGHEPILVSLPIPEQLMSADVLVVEPVPSIGAALAQAASIANPSLPLICASVTAPAPELAENGVVFDASLVKPFTVEQFNSAIDQALRSRRDDQDDRDLRHERDAA